MTHYGVILCAIPRNSANDFDCPRSSLNSAVAIWKQFGVGKGKRDIISYVLARPRPIVFRSTLLPKVYVVAQMTDIELVEMRLHLSDSEQTVTAIPWGELAEWDCTDDLP